MKLAYIVGEPGVGKSTLVKSFTGQCPIRRVHHMPVLHTSYSARVAQIGEDREEFGGTDTLGYLQPIVQMWLNKEPYPCMLGEGDRLNNFGFFEFLIDQGIELTVIALWAPELARERREERAERVGKAQKEWWLKTRTTKVENAIEEFVDPEWLIDASLPLEEQRAILQKHQVFQELERAAEHTFEPTELKTFHELPGESDLPPYLQPLTEGGPLKARRKRGKRKSGTTTQRSAAEGAVTAPQTAIQLDEGEKPIWMM